MLRHNEERTASNWIKEASKGYIRVAVLILLSKHPAHGYEIMKEIKDRTKGLWMPTPGGVYPILRDLEKAGYIKGKWSTQRNRKIKVYEITEAGRLIFKRAIEKQSELANSMNTLFREFARDVLNIGPTTLPMPMMPTPFSPFLEEEHGGKGGTEGLVQKRRYLERTITTLKEELRKTDDELARRRPDGSGLAKQK
ncbi:MAG: PadR family transcriptional regulator [Conexivisphaerales archaeon]|jgi:DNA-binding PadR family transcriptional regulator